jgi:hypothetical protein
VICSVGSYEDWRPDAKEFKKSDLGDDMDEWEGERWSDVRSANVRRIVQKVGGMPPTTSSRSSRSSRSGSSRTRMVQTR